MYAVFPIRVMDRMEGFSDFYDKVEKYLHAPHLRTHSYKLTITMINKKKTLRKILSNNNLAYGVYPEFI